VLGESSEAFQSSHAAFLFPSVAALYLIIEWTLRIVMLFYVPHRKTPAAARTWLLFIFFLPVVGVLLYAWFGRIYLPKKRHELHGRAATFVRRATHQWNTRWPLQKREVPPLVHHTTKLVERLGEFAPLGGNAVELLDEYDTAILRLIGDIDAAEHHIHLLYYIIADDAVGRKVVEALGRAVRRGVACRVLMDYLGSRPGLTHLAPVMTGMGIEVSAMLPVGMFRAKAARFDLRNHRKIVVIDGQVGYIGSQNLVISEFKPGLIFEDLVARVEGPVVSQLQVTFLADRYCEVESEIGGEGLFPMIKPAGSVTAQLLPSGPGYTGASVQHLVVALIHDAEKRIVITTPYFVPDEPLLQALQTAVMSGVEVHLILPHERDQFLVGFAQQSFYEELLECGVRIHLYKPRFLHAKHMSIDDSIAVVGSSNVDIRSFALNSEVSLVIYDKEIVQRQRAIEARYLESCDELTLEEWNKRSFMLRAFQNMCRLVDSFL